MDPVTLPPISKPRLVFALLGLGILQQTINFGSAAIWEQMTHAPGVLLRPQSIVETAAFIVFIGLVNGAFYNTAWLNLLDAARVRARLLRVYLVGLLSAVVFFSLFAMIGTIIDRTRSYATWGQVITLVFTLASGFRISDAYSKSQNDDSPEA